MIPLLGFFPLKVFWMQLSYGCDLIVWMTTMEESCKTWAPSEIMTLNHNLKPKNFELNLFEITILVQKIICVFFMCINRCAINTTHFILINQSTYEICLISFSFSFLFFFLILIIWKKNVWNIVIGKTRNGTIKVEHKIFILILSSSSSLNLSNTLKREKKNI